MTSGTESLFGCRNELAIYREFFDAHWVVEVGVGDFELHAEQVERLRAAQQAVVAIRPCRCKHGAAGSHEYGCLNAVVQR